MKPLRDREAHTPLLKKAHALLDAVEPLPDSHERMQRVRRALDRPRGFFVGAMHLPAPIIAMLIGLFGASAFAAVRLYAAVQPHVTTPTFERSRQQPAAHPPQRAMQHITPAPALPKPSVAIRAEHPTRQTGQASQVSARSRTPVPAAVPVRGEVPAAVSNDSELVHGAVKALRRDRNPALAARLLEDNRARNPSGPLAEEALSLQIEAALALHDARARTLAGEYLLRYPNGRYLRVAHLALEGAAP